MKSTFPVGTRSTACEVCAKAIGDADVRHAFPADLRSHIVSRGRQLLGKAIG